MTNYIIENTQDVQFQTITELAKNTQTSEATVVRLCRDMGYKGYSDFRVGLAIDLSQTASQNALEIEGYICVGASSIVGRYLSFRLLRIGKKVTIHEDTHLAAMNTVRGTEGDLWISVSSSGSTKEVVHAATQAYKHGVPIVSLMNISHSPLAVISTEMLVAARLEDPLTGGAFSSKVGALLLFDVLVNTLLDIYPEYSDSVLETAEVVMPLMIT